jgi:Ca2+-binding RTX toxin-like protein
MLIDGGGGAAVDRIDYSALARAVSVNVGTSLATGAARFLNVESFVGSTVPSTSSIRAGNGTNLWTVDGANLGTVNGKSFSGFANLIGGRGSDKFAVADGGTAGLVDGGAGADVLDYSLRSTAVTVNLGTNTAQGFTSAKNVRMVIGTREADFLTAGAAPALLLGGAGDDTLTGGNGKDVLIGGSGADTITGGNGQDMLYGGLVSTYYNDTTRTLLPNGLRELDMILQSWNRATAYTPRVAWMIDRPCLQGAGLDDDSAVDRLYGQLESAQDWFLVHQDGTDDDMVHDQEAGEIITVLPLT